MKNFIWLLTIAFVFTNCANENSETAENSQEPENTDTSSEPKHYKASPDAPLVGLWVIEFALGSANVDKEELSKQYEGRWLNLGPDNTFESGIWQEKNNAGTWSYDAEQRIILLNYKQAESIGFEWKIQGQGDRMVWLGNTPQNTKGTQLSLSRITELPQKESVGH